MLEQLQRRFAAVTPPVDFCSLRYVHEKSEQVAVRQDIVQPVITSEDAGAMLTVAAGRGIGYAATSDLSEKGLKRAIDRAMFWAGQTAGRSVVDPRQIPPTAPRGEYRTPVQQEWRARSLDEKIDLLARECARLKTDDRIVDWQAALWYHAIETGYLTSTGGRVQQFFHWLMPILSASANAGSETQTRSLGGGNLARQGGLEVLDQVGFHDAAPRLAEEALELLAAPNCPSGALDLLLMPDQMMLQIHESIGHPLELDRILGDERNYAGTSFVTPEMFGTYQYGSELLNITFDPARSEELASYKYDDEGFAATREYLIKDGILQRPLGGRTSQARSGLSGVANARASSWNRPPIDRMANLNLEPADKTLDELIESIDDGVMMEANLSWSIDDSRNKFQFGCQVGRRIKNGQLAGLVKNPNYRGVSATFWRSLRAVGNTDTMDVCGTPFCGKGEPNQCIRVGHASPACVFSDVETFGGGA